MKAFLQLSAVVVVLAASILPTSAGRIEGPGISNDVVYGQRRKIYPNVRLKAGEPAIVVLSGDGQSQLNLCVYDQHGIIAGSTTGHTDRRVVRFAPAETGLFTVNVVNVGDRADRYELRVN